MKAKKRAGVRKLIKSEDAERRRKVDAAIRHAQKVVRETGVCAPVVFRSTLVGEPSSQAPTRPAPRPRIRNKNNAGARVQPANPAMDEALRKALNLAPRPCPAPREPLAVKGSPPPSSAAKAAPMVATPRTIFSRGSEGKATETLPTNVAKRAAKKAAKNAPKKATKRVRESHARPLSKASSRLAKLTKKLRSERIDREGTTELNEISRRDLNARLSSAKDAERAAGQSPFEKLKRDWSAAFNMLQRYEDQDPNAANVVDARRRLYLIEAEWDRRHALKPGDPDYFPWPSTDINPSSSDGNAIERREIGMLSYLGYHVGLGSQLTGSQRTRLLGQIFTMRLPPLNGLDYMRDWGAPRTGPRLRKIAENIASFAKNAKGKNHPSMDTAISHWEDDLKHLRRHFYDRRFDFQWPRS
ncbi:hypothetical protein [Sphingopyxis sp. USTB-05]|uniref:hypothetical protein n=1 Tax=Sphingopyxis sp. USTB-05 TaxID=2830667 RepID=UPI0020787264|nr:hypothetical protein [Sphingopyxis sp. USTB-05]USI79081.1 hypothetical protein KEC45_09410 [Sphingopyxis sp. USTB-05]